MFIGVKSLYLSINLRMVYRRLGASDCEVYRQVRKRALRENPTAFGSDYADVKDLPRLGFEAYLEKQHDDTFAFGAFDNEALVGLCSFFRGKNNKERHRGFIIQMYVVPQMAGQGIGLTLLKTVIAETQKLEGLYQFEIEVNLNNKAAINIYEKAGFKSVAILPNNLKYEGEYYDFLLMVRGDVNCLSFNQLNE